MVDLSASDPYLDLLSTEDPAPLLHRLRLEDPVHYVSSLGFWFVTRHDDVKRLYHDPEHVTPDPRVWERFEPRPEGSMLRWVDDAGLMGLTPEAHARIRRLVASAFTPRAIRRMEAQIREVVERFAASLRGREGEILDLLTELTNPVPNAVISRLTGIPPAGDDEARFRELALSIIRAFFPFTTPDAVREAEVGFGELATWVRQMAAERRRAPRVRDDRSLVPRAVNEILRFAFGGPAGVTRYAVRDFPLRGRQIRRGQMLMLSFGGANRDPAVYSDPDLDRDTRDLLVFGNGPHYCLGANLARVELEGLLDAVLDIAPPGSRVRDDLRRFQDTGLYKRPLDFPVEIAEASR